MRSKYGFLPMLLLMALPCRPVAQCGGRLTLKTTGYCLGDTLTVVVNDSIVKIDWYNGAALDSIVWQADQGIIGYTVAGGNGYGPGANQLKGPAGIFVDPAGNLYVADIFNDRIQKWSPGSSFGLTVAGGKGVGAASDQLSGPEDIYLDNHNNLFIADNENNRVQKWVLGDTIGTTVAGGNGQGYAANQLILPWGIFVDQNGFIFVSDATGKVREFPPGSNSTTNGAVVAGQGSNPTGPDSGPTQLNAPLGLFIDASHNLYVADQDNSRVQLFPPGSSSGITVAGGNGAGPASNQISAPSGVFVDGKGNVFVSDASNNRVQEWIPGADAGITVAGGNGLGSSPNQLYGPQCVYVDTAGALYVSDYGNNRVQKYAHYYTIWKTYIPSIPGTYTALITDGAGCMATTNAIVISPVTSSILSVSPSSATVCSGSPATFTALPQNGGTTPSYQWQVDGNAIGPDNSVFTDSTLHNGDTVRCILTSSLTCANPSTSNSVPITVLPVPVVSAGNDTVIVPGASVSLDPLVSGSITGYRWTPAEGLNDPFIARPIASPAITTAYLLTVTADNGCTASSKTTVYVYRQLHMPAAFTPNGDGRNDVFRIPPSTPQKLIAFSVFNRWGARIFSTQDGSAGWDGTCNGEKQPAGTYVWVIEYYDPLAEKKLTARGTVLLIR